MRRISTIRDVADWRLCVGCGACRFACPNGAVTLVNIDAAGIRPKVDAGRCKSCAACLSVCPGYRVEAFRTGQAGAGGEAGIGATLEIWEGHATDKALRHAASSGGVLSALALYGLEKGGMGFALHTAMDPEKPWLNQTVTSRSRQDILARTGSRYSPASPCEDLRLIEDSDRPCVFIGKPCDAAAATMARRSRARLDANLGAVLTFFCAGTPSTAGTRALLGRLDVPPAELGSLRYRGNGWPGDFVAERGPRGRAVGLPYEESWSFLEKHRPFRCHLCPDGTGQLADISCGDAWHRFSGDGDAGLSLVLVRSETGRRLIRGAMSAGYLNLVPAGEAEVKAAQKNLLGKHACVFGRLLGMSLLAVPSPKYKGFSLFRSWRQLTLEGKLRTVVGTGRRLIQRGLWHRLAPPTEQD